jgi:hypothetical protein
MRGWERVGRRDRLAAAVALGLALSGAAPSAAADWTVKTVARTDGPGTRCVVESTPQAVPDGYQTSTVHLTVDERSVAVTSASNLDASFGDIGLSVDGGELVLLDRLAGPKTALFDAKHDRLVERFRAGTHARVQLRFWPEWPATGTHSATLSLLGFTKAYDSLARCR